MSHPNVRSFFINDYCPYNNNNNNNNNNITSTMRMHDVKL